jgi:hypothetical protein
MPRRFGGTLTPAVARAAGGAAGSSAAGGGSGTFFAHGQTSAGPVGSASLLSRIRERQEATGEAAPEAPATRLLQQVCAFLTRCGGKATSAQLVAEFQKDDVDARMLKQLLKECTDKDASGKWVLKRGFVAP